MAAEAGKTGRNLANNLTMAGLLVIAVLVAGTIYTSERELRAREQTYIEQEDLLMREIAEEEARTAELEERKKYVTTDQYIKEIAREKLGLLSEDEIMLKARESD